MSQYVTLKRKDYYDVVVCLETLEHAGNFWNLLSDIGDKVKYGGFVLLSARGATPDGRSTIEHNFPRDYWRFMPQSVPHLFKLAGCKVLETMQDPLLPGFMGIGVRNAW